MRWMNALMLRGLVGMTVLLALPTRARAAPAEPPVAVPAATETPVPQAAPPAPEPAVPSAGVKRSTVALIAAGVAVAGAGVATVFGVLALQSKNDYEKSPTNANSGNGNNDAAYADGGIALAVAAGVTSLVLLLTDDTRRDASAAVSRRGPATFSATPIVTASGGGAGFLLRF